MLTLMSSVKVINWTYQAIFHLFSWHYSVCVCVHHYSLYSSLVALQLQLSTSLAACFSIRPL